MNYVPSVQLRPGERRESGGRQSVTPVAADWTNPPVVSTQTPLPPALLSFSTPSMGSTISAEVLELIDNRLEYQVWRPRPLPA